MEILRNIQKQAPLSPAIQTFCVHFPQLQLLYLLLVKKHIPLYHGMLDILNVQSVFVMQILVIGQLCARTFLLTVLGLRYFGIVHKKNMVENIVLKFLKVKIKILIVISLNWNTLAYTKCDSLFAAIALFNLVVTIGELLVTRILNSSYRFEQQNLVCQKNTSLLTYMLLFPIIYLLDYYDIFYTSCLIAIRSIAQIYYNFNNVENRAIQYCDYFCPLVMLSLGFIDVIEYIFDIHVFQSDVLIFSVIMIAIFFSSHMLTDTLMLSVPKYHLRKCPYFVKNQNKQQSVDNEAVNTLNQDKQHQFIVNLRVLAKVYIAKQKADGLFAMRQNPYHPSPQNSDEFNQWWQQFNKILINHRVYCTNVTCKCSKLKKHSKQNSKIESEVFLNILFNLLQKTLIQRKSVKLSIIEKYFYIELLEKPIKNYYQLIKLKDQVKKSEEILQVEALMLETRQKFGNLLQMQKTQNQELEILALFEFQRTLNFLKQKFIESSSHYKKFYELFSTLAVEIPELKKLTQNLEATKKQIDNVIDLGMENFSKNLEFLTSSLIYYRYFNEYTQKSTKIEFKMNTIQQIKKFQLFDGQQAETNNKKSIDVFNPIYGAIKIDMVWRPGEIVSVTKNICELLNYKTEELEGQKVNKIMPYMFARYHDRYLRNFVEKGQINIMKKKEAVFYARNADKFILAITIRLKVEYLSSEGFYTSSLIKRTPTNSEFILLNNYGKIEQISQKMYKLLFYKGFKDEISKVKRMNIFKMVLSLNHFVKDKQEMDGRIYEGMITTVDNETLLYSYYKFLELGMQKKHRQTYSSNSVNEGSQSSRSQSKRSGFTETSTLKSFSETKTVNNQPDFDEQRCANDMKQMLKQFYSIVNLDKIKAYKISYKLFDMKTTQFSSKVLEIMSISQEVPSKILKKELARQILQIGELYTIEEEKLSKFRDEEYLRHQFQQEIIPSTEIQHQIKMRRKGFSVDKEEQKFLDSLQDFKDRADQVQEEVKFQTTASVSSLNSHGQKTQQKSTIISSFDLKIDINAQLQTFLKCLIFSVVIVLAIICQFSTTLQPDYEKVQRDNLIISNLRISLDFRLAFEELEHFYNIFNMNPPAYLEEKKHLLTNNMKKQLTNSIKWIDQEISDQFYFKSMSLIHYNSGFKEQRPILSTLNQIYSMLIMANDRQEHLINNYATIRQNLDRLAEKQIQIIMKASLDFSIKIYVILGVYGLITMFMMGVMALINNQSKEKQRTIIDLLPYVNVRKVREKMVFYEKLINHIKEKQGIQIFEVQEIEQQSIAKIQEEKNNRKSSFYDDTRTPSKLLRNQDQDNQSTSKLNSNARSIRVKQSGQSSFNCLHFCLFIIFSLILIGVVVPTQYFFDEAHNKFVTYIELKESAMMVKNLAPKTLLTDLINIDKILQLSPVAMLPTEYYKSPTDQLFDLRHKLAEKKNFDTQLAQVLNGNFDKKICQVIACDGKDQIGNQVQIYYLTYRFINALEYMRLTIPEILPQSNNSKEIVRKWISENNIEKLLTYIEHILAIMQESEQQITKIFIGQINSLQFLLLLFTLTLIPLLVMSLYFVREKFMEFVYERLSSVEAVYKQFAWDLLMENSYALNYFESKLRNSKKY